MKDKFKETLSNILAYLLKVERRTLLWENPNPNTGVGAQTISLDLSEFDAVEIEAYYVSTDANNRTLYSNRLPFGTAAVLAPQGQGHAISARKATINNTGVTFTTGHLFYSTTDQVSVDAAVPVRIYGIKSGGVLRNPVVSRLCAILKIGGGVNEGKSQGTADEDCVGTVKGHGIHHNGNDTLFSRWEQPCRRVVKQRIQSECVLRNDNSNIRPFVSNTCYRQRGRICSYLEPLWRNTKRNSYNHILYESVTLSERGCVA